MIIVWVGFLCFICQEWWGVFIPVDLLKVYQDDLVLCDCDL